MKKLNKYYVKDQIKIEIKIKIANRSLRIFVMNFYCSSAGITTVS